MVCCKTGGCRDIKLPLLASSQSSGSVPNAAACLYLYVPEVVKGGLLERLLVHIRVNHAGIGSLQE